MNYRPFGSLGYAISEVSLGTWQVGGGWGKPFDDATAERIIHDAIDAGITFIDTADVYSAGKSEAAVGRVVRSRSERVYVASKCGRQITPHVAEGYTPTALRTYVEQTLERTGLERLDLIQLHCPPTDVYYRPEIFALFDDLVAEGKIAALGVSVERVEEALKAIEYPNVRTIQIIFNMVRQRPAERLFARAVEAGVGIIVRVPLASGLLAGKWSATTSFDPEDHRTFNRRGEAFDVGETFSGVPFEEGLQIVEALRAVLPSDHAMAASAIRWILDHPAVSTVIPGASRREQVASNVAAASLPPLGRDVHRRVRAIYDERVRTLVHGRW